MSTAPTDQDTTYHSLVDGAALAGTAGSIRAVNPATNGEGETEFTLLDDDQVTKATEAAEQAFAAYRTITPQQRSAFLTAAAAKIEASGEQIITTAMAETGLPQQRLQGELARTVNQLRLFAKVAETGDHLGVRIEPALPDRKPLPRPDLRQRKLALGPVAVFGASNFPLAFSVAGGDTASALAAGCPVVFKAHNAHPGTSQIVGQAICAAVAEQGLPSGVFSLVYGHGKEVGQALVRDPRIKAVGFTGSRSGGTALMETAAARSEPIPVYAEMSSINPIFVLPSALEKSEELASGFVTSLTGSAGQLCTAPGLLFVPEGPAGDAFVEQISQQLSETTGSTMLTPGICASRKRGEETLAELPGVAQVARGAEGSGENAPAAAVYSTDVSTFLSTAALSEEIFGSVCLVIRYANAAELTEAVTGLEGQLTATLHLDEENADDVAVARNLLPHLELKAGRILVGGWPTGVDVGDAIVHGGPFPATSDGRSTSVGTLAIDRWLRPVAYQNLPEALQPQEVRESNPWHLTRRINGEYQLASRK
ncbi:aldehyde dehydrogenase (NADP(+)) [Nesterenkonia sp. MY13]|uniref:Aldehyde dehydrogenase (NADP(+)) n=1 Tax=Nesterenkonia sedimenti TaxID=1463632 RepID=A0A7X8TJ33_9MICC|nr:aldehyde dehydrogenase (NADP(+)) [Nesterenkonia sedimenti]NLS09678.1 aldehyde dehydrogenase (NADP(+)) [Nesterenkonia sedimenti]